MWVRSQYGSCTRIGPPPAVRDAYSCTTVLALSASSSARLDYSLLLLVFVLVIFYPALMKPSKHFVLPFNGSFEASCV